MRCLALALTLAATPALAEPTPYRHVETPEGTVLIVVAPADLLECEITLAFVLAPLSQDENGNPLPEPASSRPPPAACVTEAG